MADDDLDRLLAAWADSHAAELIARAEADALAAAARRLKDRMEAALLGAAARRLAGASDVRREPASEPLVWVYGIVDAGVADVGVGEGVDGHPVTVHRRGGLGALVSRVPHQAFSERALSLRLEDLDAVAGLGRAHDGVLEAAMSKAAVVPFRLCTIYSSLERLDAMLASETAKLTATLRRLEGAQEWGVKAFARAPGEVSADEPSPAPASGTAYL